MAKPTAPRRGDRPSVFVATHLCGCSPGRGLTVGCFTLTHIATRGSSEDLFAYRVLGEPSRDGRTALLQRTGAGRAHFPAVPSLRTVTCALLLCLKAQRWRLPGGECQLRTRGRAQLEVEVSLLWTGLAPWQHCWTEGRLLVLGHAGCTARWQKGHSQARCSLRDGRSSRRSRPLLGRVGVSSRL